jgi:MFS family permease
VRATLVVFFVTGGVFASWGARIPAVQEQLGLSPGQLAIAILGIEGGAIAGLPLGGMLTARLGSRTSLRLAFPHYAAGLAALAFAPTLPWLALALALTAASNSVLDVAMNAQGVELERRERRPLLSRLHAGHSFGVLAGGLVGTVAATARVDVRVHFAAVAAAGLVAGLAATRRLSEGGRQEDGPLLARPGGRLAALAAIAFCAFLIDGTAINWSAVDLRSLGAGPGLAAGAFTAFALSVAVVRLAGDRLLARHGRGGVVRVAGLVAGAGALLIVAAPGPVAALVGWAVLGAGTAVIAPAVLGAAPDVTELPPGVAIAAVTTVGYLGSFTGPPAIGAAAELAGLSAALIVLLAAAAAVVLLARASLGGR